MFESSSDLPSISNTPSENPMPDVNKKAVDLSWYFVYLDNLCKGISSIESDAYTATSNLNGLVALIDSFPKDGLQPNPADVDKLLSYMLIILTELSKSSLASQHNMAWAAAIVTYKLRPYLSKGGEDILKTEIVKLHNTYRQAFTVLMASHYVMGSLSDLNIYEPRYIAVSNVAMSYGAIASVLIQFVS